jgi:hypothetical protein
MTHVLGMANADNHRRVVVDHMVGVEGLKDVTMECTCGGRFRFQCLIHIQDQLFKMGLDKCPHCNKRWNIFRYNDEIWMEDPNENTRIHNDNRHRDPGD